MGKLRRRFIQTWKGIARNLETGLDEDRQESLNIVLSNDLELPNLLQNINVLSAIQRYPLGCRLQVGERVFRYAHIRAAGAAGVRGRVAVCTDAGLNRAANLGAIVAGAYTVNWTVVGANLALNQLRGGYILMQGGFVHKIRSNTAGNIGAVIVLTLYEPFQAIEALPAGRYGLLLESPYANVDIFTATGAGRAMGVYVAETVANQFTWLQTWGPAGIIATPATLGNVMAEIELCQNQVGEEVSNRVQAAAMGFTMVGHSWVGGGAVNWDSENFLHIWLMIDP
jgi:hypothetical protein